MHERHRVGHAEHLGHRGAGLNKQKSRSLVGYARFVVAPACHVRLVGSLVYNRVHRVWGIITEAAVIARLHLSCTGRMIFPPPPFLWLDMATPPVYAHVKLLRICFCLEKSVVIVGFCVVVSLLVSLPRRAQRALVHRRDLHGSGGGAHALVRWLPRFFGVCFTVKVETHAFGRTLFVAKRRTRVDGHLPRVTLHPRIL